MRKKMMSCASAVALFCGLFGISPLQVVQAQDVNDSIVNVTSYGAVGDGKTDDTKAFQQAFQALVNGGQLIVPKGTYVVQDNVLNVPSGISIVGDQAEIVPPASAIDGWQLLEIHGSNISISGLTFNGNGKFVRGITIQGGSTNISIANTTMENFSIPKVDSSDNLYSEIPTGIRVEGDCHNVTFSNDTISNISAMNGSSQTARGIWICPTENPDGSPQGMTTNVMIQDSQFQNIQSPDNADGIVTQGFSSGINQNLQIVDNHFTDCAKRAIKIQTDGVDVLGNVIENSSSSSSNMYAGISAYASNAVIKDNSIQGSGGYYCGVEVGSGNSISGISVEDNQISNGNSVDVSVPLTSIRIFGSVDKITMRNNKLNHAEYAILFSHATNTALIENNLLTGIMQPKVFVQNW